MNDSVYVSTGTYTLLRAPIKIFILRRRFKQFLAINELIIMNFKGDYVCIHIYSNLKHFTTLFVSKQNIAQGFHRE